jgi:hypothetical protein
VEKVAALPLTEQAFSLQEFCIRLMLLLKVYSLTQTIIKLNR